MKRKCKKYPASPFSRITDNLLGLGAVFLYGVFVAESHAII
jgi:hypothetical protein